MRTNLAAERRILSASRAGASPSAARDHRRAGPALKLKRILVPIDFSGCSKKALQYAISLAQDYHARVVLIHVLEERLAVGQRLRDLEMELETLARQEGRGKVLITTRVRVGEPLREIIDLARAEAADLLLISTHARAGLPDFCLGSAAEQIVRYAPCPVLVVREQEHDFLREPAPPRPPKRRAKKRGQ